MTKFLVTLFLWLEAPVRWFANRTVKFRREYYMRRTPPWMDIGDCTPLSEQPGNHDVTFASRHAIAEGGLWCDNCKHEAAGRGDYSGVRTTREGEAVVCDHCGQIMLAGPDTEHGDDLLPYDPKTFHCFKRISKEQALKEQWGGDLSLTDTGVPATNLTEQPKDKGRFSVKRLAHTDPNKALFERSLTWDEVSRPADLPDVECVSIGDGELRSDSDPHPKEHS